VNAKDLSCRDARELLQKPLLKAEEKALLRQCASSCHEYALEIEGALLLGALSGQPLESPSVLFVHEVMAKVEKVPAPVSLTTEQKWAWMGLAASLAIFTYFWTFVQSRFSLLPSPGFTLDLSMGPVREFFSELLGWLEVLSLAMQGLGELLMTHGPGNLVSALLLLALLALGLFASKLRKVRAPSRLRCLY